MRLEGEADFVVFRFVPAQSVEAEAEPEPDYMCAEQSGSMPRPIVRPILPHAGNGATIVQIMTPFRTPAYMYREKGAGVMCNDVSLSATIAFEHAVATRLRSDFPRGWIAHDIYVGEEQIDVLAVLPQGIFAIECKAYHGQISGDPNSAWLACTNGHTTVLTPRSCNPYRQVLRKAFAIGDYLTAVVQANGWSHFERPWINTCVVVPETTELSGIRGIMVNSQGHVPRGHGRALVFQPSQLSAYIQTMNTEVDNDAARALVVALGGTVDGTWLERQPIRPENPPSVFSQPRSRLRLQIVWDD